ncbi:DNA cytosine methyltransferase [Cyclobacterium qasimii]|uniref:Cytosine-specific methyltransferase n=2 Tax=Cyclobacterium qasimii TaxID=1350429 RepID=S7WMP0_9BACT|nr:DNA (cytosine-5-)-methyltransferase [Cyclobacterium qasimii]EPR65478.1 DNA-cytosine methyltransferase [Cyclobacterium qasimii M12-11B]GEO19653.1 cytosine-specific methyltransferase [Cyclobacterium qasimii]
MKYIEIFSGIGGFRKALELLNEDFNTGFHCNAFSEIDQFAINNYQANYNLNGEIHMGDINAFTSQEDSVETTPDFSLLIGGFPCQTFSLMGKQKGMEDERGKVLFSVDKILKAKKPEFIILENVRNLAVVNKGETLNYIKQFFRDHDYKHVTHVLLDTQNYGLPQRRARIFIVCSRIQSLPEITEKLITENFNQIGNHSLCTYDSVLDILEKNADAKYTIRPKTKRIILADGSKNFWSKSEIDLPIARTLTATMAKMHRASQDNYYSEEYIQRGISNQGVSKEEIMEKPIRRLTPEEALKLQGFTNEFCQNARQADLSDSQLYKQAGNALSVNTAYALLHYLFVKHKLSEITQ